MALLWEIVKVLVPPIIMGSIVLYIFYRQNRERDEDRNKDASNKAIEEIKANIKRL